MDGLVNIDSHSMGVTSDHHRVHESTLNPFVCKALVSWQLTDCRDAEQALASFQMEFTSNTCKQHKYLKCWIMCTGTSLVKSTSVINVKA